MINSNAKINPRRVHHRHRHRPLLLLLRALSPAVCRRSHAPAQHKVDEPLEGHESRQDDPVIFGEGA
jgi:hypothetical protein